MEDNGQNPIWHIHPTDPASWFPTGLYNIINMHIQVVVLQKHYPCFERKKKYNEYYSGGG